ncbi:MAG: hypothetical protein ABIV48_10495 [Pyrinomonadaceae bacterium]
MRKKNPTDRPNQNNDPNRLRTYVTICACSLLLLGGFFFAGRQHFSSMDFGMKNSRLRKQVDELEAEKRRLLLAREISLSPFEIMKNAKKIAVNSRGRNEDQLAELASEKGKRAAPTVAGGSMILKTAAVSPIQTTVISASFAKREKHTMESKATQQAE